MSKQTVTMQMIADAVGVGKVTVSRAFRKDPKCGAALRERILAKAAEVGYVPDPLQRIHLAQLRTGRRAERGRVIALLDVHDRGSGLEELASNRRFVVGAQARAAELGMRVEIFRPVVEGISLERMSGVWRARGIHGLIVGPVSDTRNRLPLKLDEIAAVAIAHSLLEPQLHRVGHNHYAALRRVMERIHAEGGRRFGMALQPDMDARVGQRWHAAFHEFGRTHRECSLALIEPVQSTMEARASAKTLRYLKAWLKREKPEVVFGISCWMPEALRETDPGRKVRYVDMDWYAGKFAEQVEGIDQQFEEVGAAAVDEVVAQWGRREYGVPEGAKTVLLMGGTAPLARGKSEGYK
jgi:DNA-binding LacI/PurR family transcriptional regulator